MSTPNDTAGKGAHYEKRAGQFLCQKGHRVIATNFRCKLGEIDLITRDPRGYQVFVEVRYRASNRFGGALASISAKKQTRLRRAAETFLVTHPRYQLQRCRFDVIAMGESGAGQNGQKINWIKSAFY